MNLIHTIYRPPGESPHPTILTLHGRGANAFDLLGLAPYLCGGQFLIICPQAPMETPIGPDQVGYAWYGSSKGGVPDTDGMLESQQSIATFSRAIVLSNIPSTPSDSPCSASAKAA